MKSFNVVLPNDCCVAGIEWADPRIDGATEEGDADALREAERQR